MARPKKSKSQDPTKEKVNPQVGIEVGGTGTILFNGVLSGQDYNAKLIGPARIDIYDEMRKGDATVNAVIEAMRLPILAANWYVKAASDDQADQDIATFIEQERIGMEITWQDFLNQAMLYLVYGNMVFETVYKLRDDGKIGWLKHAPRLPKTILYWNMRTTQQPGITQFVPIIGYKEIPDDKLMKFIHRQEGDNYEGFSILRSSYKNWVFKEMLYKVEAISVERQGMGIPIIRMPPGGNDTDKTAAELIGKNLRANEQAYIVVKGQEWQIEMLDMKGATVKDAQPAIQHHDRQISKNILAQFMELSGGARSTGSHALAKSQTDLFLLSLNAVARHIADVFNTFAIKRLVDLNFAGVENYPTLEFNTIGKEDLDVLSNALLRLTQSKLITPDPSLEQYLRDTMELPEMPDGMPEENDLLKTMNDIENKPPEVPAPAASAATIGDESGGDAPDNADDAHTNQYLGQPVLSPAKVKLKKLVAETKIQLLAMKQHGKLDPEAVKKLHMDLLKAKAEADGEQPPAPPKQGRERMLATEAKSRIDHVLDALEKEIEAS